MVYQRWVQGRKVDGLVLNRIRLEDWFVQYLYLDLLPIADIPHLIEGFYSVLTPGGRLVVVALTEGVDIPSRALVAVWKAAYSISPVSCAGCRPLQLSRLVEKAGFERVSREVVVQLAVPSEILAATK